MWSSRLGLLLSKMTFKRTSSSDKSDVKIWLVQPALKSSQNVDGKIQKSTSGNQSIELWKSITSYMWFRCLSWSVYSIILCYANVNVTFKILYQVKCGFNLPHNRFCSISGIVRKDWISLSQQVFKANYKCKENVILLLLSLL